MHASALAALAGAALLARTAAGVIGTGQVAWRRTGAVAVRGAGLIAAAIFAAGLPGLAAISRSADTFATLRLRAAAFVFRRLAHPVAALLAIGAATTRADPIARATGGSRWI